MRTHIDIVTLRHVYITIHGVDGRSIYIYSSGHYVSEQFLVMRARLNGARYDWRARASASEFAWRPCRRNTTTRRCRYYNTHAPHTNNFHLHVTRTIAPRCAATHTRFVSGTRFFFFLHRVRAPLFPDDGPAAC
jgi:hypothetical protein